MKKTVKTQKEISLQDVKVRLDIIAGVFNPSSSKQT
jgi:hypothetical protein